MVEDWYSDDELLTQYVLPRLRSMSRKIQLMVLPDTAGVEPHSSEPIDLSLTSLWVQVLEVLCDPQRRNTGSFPEIHQRQ